MKRRDLLKTSLATWNTLATRSLWATMANSLVRGAVQSATAEENGLQTRNYVSFSLVGAPPRFVFDHFLKTRESDPFVTSAGVATRFGAGVKAGIPVYEVGPFQRANGTSILVPPLWKTHVLSSSGSSVPLSHLLPNMLIFRGYGSSVDGHPTNFIKQSLPVPALVSLGGLVADQSRRLFPAIEYPYFRQFSSYKSANLAPAQNLNAGPTENPLQILHKPFQTHDSTRPGISLRKRYQDFVDNIHTRIKTNFDSDPKFQKYSRDLASRARDKINRGLSNFDSYWATAFPRYRSVVEGSARQLNVPNFSDLPVVPDLPNDPRYRITESIRGNPFADAGFDHRHLLNSWSSPLFAQMLAVTEYVLKERLAQTLELGSLYMRPTFVFRTGGADILVSHEFDAHATGSFADILTCSALYRGFGAGLIELVNNLKSSRGDLGGNLFEETIIHITSDFGRSPRMDATGSDHGFDAMITSVIGGCVHNGPWVIGNILKEQPNPGVYPGTWGWKGPSSVGGQSVVLTPTHVVRTIGDLLNAPANPWANLASPLGKIESGIFKPLTEEGRIL